MSPREEMLRCMQNRAVVTVREGEPIIPDGPSATTEDIQEFKRLVEAMGYEVKFGRTKALTRPARCLVEITARCTVGVLSDEFLHVWNNYKQRRGLYMTEQSSAEEHRHLGSTFRLSGSSNDRRFHQLELYNYSRFLALSGGVIPVFLWRTFSETKRANKLNSAGPS